MKKAFQVFCLLCSAALGSCSVGVFFEEPPSQEQLVLECNQLISTGAYETIQPSERENACLEDSYKALGASPAVSIPFSILLFLLALIALRYGIRIFR